MDARDLTDTERDGYDQTVTWAAALHAHRGENGHQLDGLVWMSRRCNTDRAYVFFGDRVSPADFDIDPGYGRVFDLADDLGWLSDLCAGLHIDLVI